MKTFKTVPDVKPEMPLSVFLREASVSSKSQAHSKLPFWEKQNYDITNKNNWWWNFLFFYLLKKSYLNDTHVFIVWQNSKYEYILYLNNFCDETSKSVALEEYMDCWDILYLFLCIGVFVSAHLYLC